MLYRKCEELEAKLSQLSTSALDSSTNGDEIDQRELSLPVAIQDVKPANMAVVSTILSLNTTYDRNLSVDTFTCLGDDGGHVTLGRRNWLTNHFAFDTVTDSWDKRYISQVCGY
jgi:hypothetical protein